MLNVNGHISECTGDNVFFVKGNTIVTPPVSAGVLVGITREVVIEIVKKKTDYRFREQLFFPKALFQADEVFFTGTAAEIIPVNQLGTTDDCGFSPFADDDSTSREIAFEKIRARVEGTKLAEAIISKKKHFFQL